MPLLATLALAHLLNQTPDQRMAFTPVSVERGPSFDGGVAILNKSLTYLRLTAEQKIRAAFLAEHGITEQDLNTLTPAERAQIEVIIRSEVKKRMGATEKAGQAG
jgi:hypothetical protein